MSGGKTKHCKSLNRITDVWPSLWGLFWFPGAGGGWRWDAFEVQGWVASIGAHLAVAASPPLLRACWHKATRVTGYGRITSPGEQFLCRALFGELDYSVQRILCH